LVLYNGTEPHGGLARKGGGNTVSFLLFMDESGHDHKRMPYEVRGGIAIHAGKLWPMVQQLQQV
jgi:hypothetical protein